MFICTKHATHIPYSSRRQKGGKIIDSMTHFIHTFIDTHVRFITNKKVHIVSEDRVERESNMKTTNVIYNVQTHLPITNDLTGKENTIPM